MQVKAKVEQIRIPNDISVLLVSPQKRMVISENAVPRSDGETAELLYSPCETETNWTENYPLHELKIREARAIIAEKLMGKGSSIHLIDAGNFQPQDKIGAIQPDFTFAVNSSRRKPFHWAFTLMSLPEDADATAAREKIRAWVSKAIVYFYLGGKLDRLSLAADNEKIYNYAHEEISALHMHDELSVIHISFLRKQIIHEDIAVFNHKKSKPSVTLI